MKNRLCLFEGVRIGYHAALLKEGVLCLGSRAKPKRGLPAEVPSNADGDSASSIAIARSIYDQLNYGLDAAPRLAGQVSGNRFEQLTRDFVEQSFGALGHLRPGTWTCSPAARAISRFEQYEHLSALSRLAREHQEAAVLLGHNSDYIIAPDIIIAREPVSDEAINAVGILVNDKVAQRTSLRKRNNETPILHASISCKWTLRSDRAQNARSEALNLIRNRKGRVPHIVVVTGEPLPSRLASLVLGTGDIDCVYHFALPELLEAVAQTGAEDSVSLMKIMTDGKRLKDISDLPLDLAV